MAVWANAVMAMASGLLILQTTPAHADNPDEAQNLEQLVAAKFDDDGRIRPIVWSDADPVFFAAKQDGLLKNPDEPSEANMIAAAQALRCEYILEVSFWSRPNGQYFCRARMWRKGRLIWQDPEPNKPASVPRGQVTAPPVVHPDDEKARSLMVAVGPSFKLDATLESVASTWFEQITSVGPLKDLKPRPRTESPQPTPGNQPPTIAVPVAPKVDNTQLTADVMRKLSEKDQPGAISLLLDAVDAAPLDEERRRLLVETLLQSGWIVEAAVQARRAAGVVEQGAQFFAMAARAYLAAGMRDEAQQDLNQAVARDPENPETRTLLAEISLGQLQLEDALRHLEAALKPGLAPRPLLLRAFLHALLEKPAEALADRDRAAQLGVFEGARAQSAYELSLSVTDALLNAVPDQARELMVRVRRDRSDPATRVDADAIEARAARALSLLDLMTAPDRHRASDGERRLALKLLIQWREELEAFRSSGDDDTLAEAQLSLGESLRRLREAQTKFQQERLTQGVMLGYAADSMGRSIRWTGGRLRGLPLGQVATTQA